MQERAGKVDERHAELEGERVDPVGQAALPGHPVKGPVEQREGYRQEQVRARRDGLGVQRTRDRAVVGFELGAPDVRGEAWEAVGPPVDVPEVRREDHRSLAAQPLRQQSEAESCRDGNESARRASREGEEEGELWG